MVGLFIIGIIAAGITVLIRLKTSKRKPVIEAKMVDAWVYGKQLPYIELEDVVKLDNIKQLEFVA